MESFDDCKVWGKEPAGRRRYYKHFLDALKLPGIESLSDSGLD